MEARNAKLSEDDKAKNLVWRMVGPRGERRLIKGLNRDREGTSRQYRRRSNRRSPAAEQQGERSRGGGSHEEDP